MCIRDSIYADGEANFVVIAGRHLLQFGLPAHGVRLADEEVLVREFDQGTIGFFQGYVANEVVEASQREFFPGAVFISSATECHFLAPHAVVEFQR